MNNADTQIDGKDTDTETFVFKECPKCGVMTEKTAGCDKIDCPNCKTKWCFYCGKKFGNKRVKRIERFCMEMEEHKRL